MTSKPVVDRLVQDRYGKGKAEQASSGRDCHNYRALYENIKSHEHISS